jgi:nitrate/TMAO reductase-like tetraheme cytochrome c subunit
MKSLILISIYFLSSFSLAQTPEKLKQTEEEIRKEMISISSQLGVTCTECHNVKNFKDDSKKSFKVSLKHLKMVELLKLNGLSGNNSEPEASCFMCHKGKLHFKYKEPITDHNRHDQEKKKITKEKIELAPENSPE